MRAAGAVENAVYKQVRVYARSGTGEIEAECRNGHVNVFRVEPEQFHEELDASGISQPRAVGARTACRQAVCPPVDGGRARRAGRRLPG